jgi:hypothetical protein
VRRVITGIVTVSMVMVGLAACQKVQKPASDSAVPTLVWHVENRTANPPTATDITGDGTVHGVKGDSYRVTLTATEAGGIHEIDMGGGWAGTCAANGLGQNQAGLYQTLQQYLNPDSQGNVLTSIFLIDNYDPEITCGSGFTWSGSTKITLKGGAQNYYSGQTTAQLIIVVTP